MTHCRQEAFVPHYCDEVFVAHCHQRTSALLALCRLFLLCVDEGGIPQCGFGGLYFSFFSLIRCGRNSVAPLEPAVPPVARVSRDGSVRSPTRVVRTVLGFESKLAERIDSLRVGLPLYTPEFACPLSNGA